MSDSLSKDLRDIFETADPRSLYIASQYYAALHHYNPGNPEPVKINTYTAQTLMDAVVAQTAALTSQNQIQQMRSARDKAITEFCYIYGGYIVWKLTSEWFKWRRSIEPYDEESGKKSKEEYSPDDQEAFKREDQDVAGIIAAQTLQILNNVINTLKRDGYQKGKLRYLISCAISKRFLNVKGQYFNRMKKKPQTGSLDKILEMVGGEIELAGIEGYTEPMEESEAEKRHRKAIVIYTLLGEVEKDLGTNYREMFERYYIRQEKQSEIARDMGVSVATVSRAVQKVADAVLALYNEMERRIQ